MCIALCCKPKILEMQLTYQEVRAKYVMRKILSVFLGGKESDALHQVFIPTYVSRWKRNRHFQFKPYFYQKVQFSLLSVTFKD